MAEAVLFPVAVEILKKLGSLASQQLGMISGLEDDLNKLNSTVSAIQAVLLDAEEGQTKSHSLQNWLQKLEGALYDAEDVLDELSTETLRREVMTRDKSVKQVRIFFSKSNQIAFNYKMARKIKNILEKLDALAAEKNKFHLRENCEPTQIMMGRETWSSPNEEEVIGREDDKKKLKDLLLDMNVSHNISFIAIVGMGGIGKTTLAKSLYHDKELSFDLKIWVWVSGQFEVKIVVKKIIESATRSNPHVDGMEALQSKLQEVIGGKKYLLVMDDVWNEREEKWHELKPLLMHGAPGSKILITKRDKKVAQEIESMTYLFTLEGLSKSKSWSLFRKVAFKEGKEFANPNLIDLGKEILVKCGGVPLVIRHIGRLLYSNSSEDEWMYVKNNELWKVIQQDNDMTPILKLSYNHLPPNLKQCFAYSSLIPKGVGILKVNELIQQWVAHGFIIKSSNESKSMEDIGKDYFKELCWRFFFENSNNDECNFDDDVYMHDVMRDLARNVAGEKYVRGNLNGDYVVSEKTRHFSFEFKIESWQDLLFKLRKAKGQLRTFQLFSSYVFAMENEINEAVLKELFSSFPRLRVLGLRGSSIDTIPNSIKKVRHLRYLNLSENYMESLPNSITELHNLQTLNLMDCSKLKKLPRDISNLANLRHLDFNPVIHMPEGMWKLSHLQTQSTFVWDYKMSNKLSELTNVLNHLNIRELRIMGLEQLRSSPSSKVSLVNLKDKTGLRVLALEWEVRGDGYENEGEGDETVMEGLQPHPNVESLSIEGYNGVRLPNWVISTSLSNLTHITIVKCHRLQHLPRLNHLQALKYLTLTNMRCLKFIEKNEPNSCSFPSLEELCLEDMPNLEGWWESGSAGDQTQNQQPIFPQLSYLHITRCPKLTSSLPRPDSIGTRIVLCDVGFQTVISTIYNSLSHWWAIALEEINDMKYLDIKESQQNLSSLGIPDMSLTVLLYLKIEKCSNLMSLPEWIGLLTSLEQLNIVECPKLKSLPEGMRQLKSLKFLKIEGCPELEERCKQGGEDWHMIAHVYQNDINGI